MLQITNALYKHSGMIVISSAFLLLISPTLFFRKKLNLTSISQTVGVYGYGHLVTLGIIISGLFQFIYAFVLSNINLSIISIAGGGFLLASLLFCFCYAQFTTK